MPVQLGGGHWGEPLILCSHHHSGPCGQQGKALGDPSCPGGYGLDPQGARSSLEPHCALRISLKPEPGAASGRASCLGLRALGAAVIYGAA